MNISHSEKFSMLRALSIGAFGETRFRGKSAAYLWLLLNEQGAEYYSQARIAIKLRCSTRAVRHALAWLRLNGLVTVVHRRRAPSRVELVLPALRAALAGTLAVTRRLIAAGIKRMKEIRAIILPGSGLPTAKQDFSFREQKPAGSLLKAAAARLSRRC